MKKKKITRDMIEHMVATNDKKRFSISEDGQKIRANQGHSISVDLALEPLTPPDSLLHGTAEKYLSLIMAEGLKKMNRHHVYMSDNKKTASAIGQRYGKLVLLKIKAQRMHQDGFVFYKSDNNVWLVDHVPAEYIDVIK